MLGSTRRFRVYIADFAIIVLAGVVAFLLRQNFDFDFDRLQDGWVYHASIIVLAALIIPMLGLDRSIWRFTSLPDYIRAFTACFLVIAGASLITFGTNRFEGLARSLPFIHIVVATFLMVGARVLFRYKHHRRHQRRSHFEPVRASTPSSRANILVVGVTRLTETYLQAVEELSSDTIRIVGLLGTKDRHVGRLVATLPVFGVAEDIETVLRDLEPHGTTINRVVVTCPFSELSPGAQSKLLALQETNSIELQLFAEQLHIVDKSGSGIGDRKANEPAEIEHLRFSFPDSMFDKLAGRPYWQVKRCLDALAALSLLIIMSPVIIATAVVVACSIGLPITFWQQRPGQAGIPFRVYKFRTMRHTHDETGRRLEESERLSKVGDFLRRTRLDELLQLYHVLVGDMSFVGPRPLLPRDQAAIDSARLLVRPGITGWAQVVGGRGVSADDKAALDVWYIKNASLALDCKIALMTIPMVLRGETIDTQSIAQAWQELRSDGVFTLKPNVDVVVK